MSPFFTPIRLLLLAGFAVTLLAGFVLVPDGTMLPVHWGLSGVADGFLPREWALLLPLLVVVAVWTIFLGIARFAKPEDMAAGRYSAGVVLTALTALMLVIAVVTVLIGIGVAVNMVQVLALGIGALLVVLGNVMPKSQPNSFAGLRLPTTLRDAANWQATHRLTGLLCIVGGVVLVPAALLAPPPGLIAWLLGCVLVPILVGSLYSLNYARRHS